MTSFILGVNSAYHEHSACLLRDGELIAFAEEERFNRIRHGKRALTNNSDDLPLQAIEYCLAQAGIGFSGLTGIGYSFDPEERMAKWPDFGDRYAIAKGDFGTEDGEREFYAHNLMARDKLMERAPGADFHFLPHHLCHASSSFHVSPFEQAAILVVDGIGEFNSTWLGVGNGLDIREIASLNYPHSIGFVWEKISELLGFDVYSGPGKLMGYACITDPIGELTGKDHAGSMREIFHPVPGGLFRVDNSAFRFRSDDFSGLEPFFGRRRTTVVDRYEEASIGAAVQQVTEEVMQHLVNVLYDEVNRDSKEPVTDLCLAGGVALNCVANTKIISKGPFKRIFIQPAANDAGTALGAAELVYFRQGGRIRSAMEHAFYGPSFGDDFVRQTLLERGIPFTSPDNIANEAASRIEKGEIIAWFQGAQEIGPRALGHRSILTDPTRFDSRNRLNTRVKYRESFRPFAPSVLSSGMEDFFDMEKDMIPSRYMLLALPLKEKRMAQIIPAVIQEDSVSGKATSRVHEVLPEVDPLYAELISEFNSHLGVPLVLNTSFNIQEPIVTTPHQALDTFLKSSIDTLAIGPFVVTHPNKR